MSKDDFCPYISDAWKRQEDALKAERAKNAELLVALRDCIDIANLLLLPTESMVAMGMVEDCMCRLEKIESLVFGKYKDKGE